MSIFWGLLLIPLLFPIAVKLIFHSEINYWEWAIQTVIGVIAVAVLYSVGKYSQIQDYEIWNGEVVSKERLRESCPIGWVDYTDNFCRHYATRSVKTGTQTCTGSGKDRRCTDDYKTQYNYYYSWEQNWLVHSNIKQSWEITRVDAQGANIPPRWAEVKVGDPVSKTNSYDNYVKAASNSLFNKDKNLAEQYEAFIPEYPIEIFDYYRVDRVLTSVDFTIPNIEEYNDLLPNILKVLGPNKQANVVMLFTDISDKGFSNAVIHSWQGAKKNDIVIIVSIYPNRTIRWVHIHSWSKNKMFNVVMRDELLDLGSIENAEKVIELVRNTTMDHFERIPMAEFEYLKDEIEPSTGFIVLTIIFMLILSSGLTYVFHKVDINPLRKS